MGSVRTEYKRRRSTVKSLMKLTINDVALMLKLINNSLSQSYRFTAFARLVVCALMSRWKTSTV